uniref:S1 motif domain-containing protein n=1 Tax=Rhodosorus marinus TaxID=101924 RepID=A0A7S3ELV9_9RHOD|mmetsp:Transcript_5094/g.22066  ORF Transcript_5094/g.22066 Transcript_5094/m.22066 type:complete len:390 (+) Transcript_5094:195-1364(+)
MDSKLGFVVGLAGHRIGPLAAKAPSTLSWQSAQFSRHSARLFMCQEAPEAAKAPESAEPEAVAEAAEVEESAVEASAVEASAAEASAAEESVVDEIAAEEEQSSDSSPTKARGRGRGRARKEVKYQIADLQVNMELDGIIRSTTKYGAFVDVGCSTDGLVHVSQLSSDYVENVEDVVKSGDNVKVRVIAVNADKNEFSLSMKPADEPGKSASRVRGLPFLGCVSRISFMNMRRSSVNLVLELCSTSVLSDFHVLLPQKPSDDRISWNAFKFDPKNFITGKVVSVTDYGAFVDVNGPTDGMVHISELSESRVESVDSILSVGDEIEVRITDADQGRRRISLSMVEWKPPGEAEAKVTASRKQLDEANEAVTSSNPFKSAFEIALEKATSK